MYQSGYGGKTYMPLENRCRIIADSTPKCARLLSWKYSEMSGGKVRDDLRENHAVSMSILHIQRVFEEVGGIMKEKEAEWGYEMPTIREEVACIAICCDGTTAPVREEGHKEVMVGSISFYNTAGERLESIYTACAPEKGKAVFEAIFAQEIEEVKQCYPKVHYMGIADGASWNWGFLEPRTDEQLTDFFHAQTYLTGASEVMFRKKDERKAWLGTASHQLKHKAQSAEAILEELKKSPKSGREKMEKAITYFTNQLKRMNYATFVQKNQPIGSGVIEAACKTLVNQRLCNSGMRWHSDAMDNILMARSLIYSADRWEQFWKKVDRYGINCTS